MREPPVLSSFLSQADVYNHLEMLTSDLHFMKQNADFQEGISQAQRTATPLTSPKNLNH